MAASAESDVLAADRLVLDPAGFLNQDARAASSSSESDGDSDIDELVSSTAKERVAEDAATLSSFLSTSAPSSPGGGDLQETSSYWEGRRRERRETLREDEQFCEVLPARAASTSSSHPSVLGHRLPKVRPTGSRFWEDDDDLGGGEYYCEEEESSDGDEDDATTSFSDGRGLLSSESVTGTGRRRQQRRRNGVLYPPERAPPIVDFFVVLTAFLVAVVAAYYSMA